MESIEERSFVTIGGFAIDLKHLLGTGKFGKVYCAFPSDQFMNPKARIACKITERLEDFSLFQNEVKILHKINSNRILKTFSAFNSGHCLYMFSELCNGGDLHQLLKLRRQFSENEAKAIFTQLLEGIKILDDQMIMHRDLKPANILIHFPDNDLLAMNKQEKAKFLKDVDLTIV